MNDLGVLYIKNNTEKGKIYYEDAKMTWEKVEGEQRPLLLGYSYNNLGTYYLIKKEFNLAIQHFGEALRQWGLCQFEFPKYLLVIPLINMGIAQTAIKDWKKAWENLTKAESLLNELYFDKPHKLKILVQNNFAHLLSSADYQMLPSITNLGQIEKRLLDAWKIQNQLYGDYPMADRVMIANKLGTMYLRQKNHQLAIYYFRIAIDVAKKVHGESHKNLIELMINLTFVLCKEKKYEEAKKVAPRALELAEKYLDPTEPNRKNAEQNAKFLESSSCIIC